MPIWRAVPAMTRKPASSVRAFRSFILIFTISMTCFLVSLPTLVLFGSLEPLAILAAFLSRMAAGGDLVMKVKDLSLIDRDDHGKDVASLLLSGGVEFLAERHDVHALLTERGADGRRGIRRHRRGSASLI